jgi:CRP/FNR family cyclic AMP-dependent transcriptional regulator
VADKRKSPDWESLLAGIVRGKTILEYCANCHVFLQGQPADSLFFLQRGRIKLAITSEEGKEAIVSILDAGEFFGEGCLAGQTERTETATSLTDCTLFRIERALMTRLIHERHEISDSFILQLLTRIMRFEAELVDQRFNSSEKRLARILLQLSHCAEKHLSESVIPPVSQEELAHMVGTTRARVNLFMNKFRTLGLIDYGKKGGLTVHSSLLKLVVGD